MLYFLQK